MEFRTVKIKDIILNANTRTLWREKDLEDLMVSIRSNGLLEPIGVRKLGNGNYDCVYGYRRLAAATKLGWTEMPCVIADADSEADFLILNLTENLHRSDVKAAEEGLAFTKLLGQGLTHSEIAARLGITKTRVFNAIEIYNHLPEKWRDKVVYGMGNKKKKGQVLASTAVYVAGLKREMGLSNTDIDALMEFARKDNSNLLAVRNVSKLVSNGFDVLNAIKEVETTQSFDVSFLMKKAVIEKLERSTGKSIGMLIREAVAGDSRFQIIQEPKRATFKRKSTQTSYVKRH